MTPGEVALHPVPQFAGGTLKLRPVLILAALPGPYQNILLCGISSQTHPMQPNWDEMIQPGDADFPTSGLHRASSIRLSYLHATGSSEIKGIIGNIDATRLQRRLTHLADFLRP